MKQQDKFCPMCLTSYNDMIGCKGPQCAWYTDAGCAIVVLATRQYKMEVEYDLLTSDDDGLISPF